jgi:hypothetical protein
MAKGDFQIAFPIELSAFGSRIQQLSKLSLVFFETPIVQSTFFRVKIRFAKLAVIWKAPPDEGADMTRVLM